MESVPKSYERVEAYGDVDELNSILGAVVSTLPDEETEIIKEIQQIQSTLFHVGARLATTPDSPALTDLKEIQDDQINRLEAAIDGIQGKLPALRGFILPGGHISAAWAHVARTVCRRAERHVVRLCGEACEQNTPEILRKTIVYLNRLSDYLFVLARYCNRIRGIQDIQWQK